MAAELTCARRTRKIVEENGEQILRKENKKKKKKENGVRTPLMPKEDKKGLNEPLKQPSSIFSPIRSVVNESTAGMLEFRDMVEFRASARLCKIPRSSLTESLSAVRARLQPRGRNLNLRPGF